MPPNSSKKRKKVQLLKCNGCGRRFTSSKSLGNHIVQCLSYKTRVAQLRVVHSAAAKNQAATAVGPPAAGHQPQHSTMTMHQQRQWINRGKANVERAAIAERNADHMVSYGTQLQSIGKTPPHQQLPHNDGDDDDGDDADDDADDADDDAYEDELMFESMAEHAGSTTDDEVNEQDEDVNDEANIPIMLTAENGAPITDAPGHTLPPTFPIKTNFDHSNSNSIRFKSTVAPCTAAGIQLMDVIGKHSVDLSLYDEIVGLLGNLADSGYDFKQKLPKRHALLQQCEEVFNYKSLRPKLIEVPVTTLDTPTITMPVFDVQAVLAKMLQNPMLIRPQNLAANYDIFTGKPLHDVAPQDPAYYDEIHTGQQWPIAVNHYCGDGKDTFPCGLVVFYDKSHADRHGSLAVSPVMFTLTLFNKTARAQSKFWDILAYVPNLDSGTNKTSDSSIGVETSPAMKMQDEHILLLNALRQLKDVNDSGGIPMKVMGKDVRVKVWIHIMVGDINGNNVLLGSYNAHNARRPYRDCSCELDSFLDPEAICTMVRKADIDQMKNNNDVDALRAASKHNIKNAFDIIPTGNPVDTIYHSTPPETMHAISSGIAKYMISTIGGKIKSKKLPAAGMQSLHILLMKGHRWQSERNASSRPSSRNFILDSSKTQATETMGNLFILMCALHTSHGKIICNDAGIGESHRRGKITTIKMILALEKWLNGRTLCTDVDNDSKIQSFIRNTMIPHLQKYSPRSDGAGWKLPKVHSLTKFPKYIQLYGSAINFYGGFGESHLKDYMKWYANFTQRRAGKFAEQLAQNHYRQSLHSHSSSAICQQTKSNYMLVEESVQQSFRGKHEITFTKRDGGSSVEYTTRVHWQKLQSSKPVDDILIYTISRYMASQDPSCKQFRITAYNVAKLPNNEETLEPYNAGPTHSSYNVDTKVDRFDWCMIKTHMIGSDEAEEHLNTWEYTCPAQIHGFIRFDTVGIPTPSLLQAHHNHADTIRNAQLTDDTTYVVVRTSTDFLHWRDLEKEFIVPIRLGGLDECTYILPVSRIVNPLYVFEDYGQPEDLPNPSFFVALPARYSAFYLDHILDQNLYAGTVASGLSQKCDTSD